MAIKISGTDVIDNSGRRVSTREARVAMAANDIDLSLGNYFTKTISATTLFTFSNIAPPGSVSAFILELTNGGTQTVTWDINIRWQNNTAPTLSTGGKRDIIGFFTYDGGRNLYGMVLSSNVT